jgi:ATP-dependent DNA ligase
MYIKQQLAKPWKDFSAQASVYSSGKYVMEAKINGLRAELTSVASYSRYGNKWGFDPACLRPLTDFLAKAGIAIDGEWEYTGVDRDGNRPHHYERYKRILSIISKDRILVHELKDVVFRAFDVIPMNGAKLSGWDRKKLLAQAMPLLQKVCPFKIEEVKWFKITSKEQFDRAFKFFIGSGEEGMMIKNLNATYKDTRTFDWMKMKFKWTSDLPIIRVELGKKGKKNENRTGVLVVKTPKGWAEIGTGFPETGKESRDWFWENKDSVGGLVVEVEHEGYANDEGKLVNASFKFVRWDKPKGELSW